MRKFPRVGATAVGALAVVLTATAFAARPSAPAPHRARVGLAAAARVKVVAGPLARIQPGGPIAVGGHKLSTVPAFSPGPTNVVSNNWGGYVVGRHGVKFRSVRASFFVPYLDCASTPSSFSGHWVGLDGFGSPTVEQDGILAACQGTTPVYAAWYEMFPLPPVYSKMTIRPGNSITASVVYRASSGKYTLTLTDTTNGAKFVHTAGCPSGAKCARLSAEAISEAPSNGSSILPLSNFRAESFSDVAIATEQGRRGGVRARWWDALSITTESGGGRVLDQPTSLSGGKTFDCYWMAES